ncbi:hypothetical protein R1flu_021272 [Riccia fluitans]|uniref:Uncharacterized protein n=1 Tax=Riccia fluitans TaxID=41844 RepID=A0ABD1ZNW4_9MARC
MTARASVGGEDVVRLTSGAEPARSSACDIGREMGCEGDSPSAGGDNTGIGGRLNSGIPIALCGGGFVGGRSKMRNRRGPAKPHGTDQQSEWKAGGIRRPPTVVRSPDTTSSDRHKTDGSDGQSNPVCAPGDQAHGRSQELGRQATKGRGTNASE